MHRPAPIPWPHFQVSGFAFVLTRPSPHMLPLFTLSAPPGLGAAPRVPTRRSRVSHPTSRPHPRVYRSQRLGGGRAARGRAAARRGRAGSGRPEVAGSNRPGRVGFCGGGGAGAERGGAAEGGAGPGGVRVRWLLIGWLGGWLVVLVVSANFGCNQGVKVGSRVAKVDHLTWLRLVIAACWPCLNRTWLAYHAHRVTKTRLLAAASTRVAALRRAAALAAWRAEAARLKAKALAVHTAAEWHMHRCALLACACVALICVQLLGCLNHASPHTTTPHNAKGWIRCSQGVQEPLTQKYTADAL